MPIYYSNIHVGASTAPATMTGANATANTDGVTGLVPAPLAANAGQFLRGDGLWATVESEGVEPEMVGATSNTDGTTGLVPQPLIGNAAQYLRGDGEWASLVLVGANTTTNTAGVAGLVPTPLAANANMFLRGDGNWAGPSLTIDTTGNATISWQTSYHKRTITGTANLLSFVDIEDGLYQSITLELTIGTGAYVVFPSEVKWPNATGPSLASGKTHLFVFTATNAATIFATSIINY